MATVLLYNIPSNKLAKLRVIFLKSGIRMRIVTEEECDYQLSSLLTNDPINAEEKNYAPFTEEMMIFCGLTSHQLDIVLASLRQKHLSTPLKAVLTETNSLWSSKQIHEEISKEHLAMQQSRSSVHK